MKRKPRKKNQKYTIMIVPHSNTAIKSIPFSQWLVKGLAVFCVATVLVVSYLALSYLNLQNTLAENEELKTVNDVQAQEIRELQKTTQEALMKLEEIIETDSRVRELVGLKEATDESKTPSRSNGQGGPGSSLDRGVQTLSIVNSDILQNFVIPSTFEIPENSRQFVYNLDENPDLNTIEKIKEDLQLINRVVEEQKIVLARLEEDVEERLDYLEAIPNGWPVQGRITDKYGWRKNPFNKKKMEFHEGLDIAASYGTPVKAAGGGRVTFVGWKPAYGYTVVIRHGYGYVSQYAHNSKINVKVGQEVKRGDVIARVGSTGRSTGPHVDFRIQYNGAWIDPLKILK